MQLKSLLILLFVLSSCSRIKISDDLWCVDAGRFGAECFYTLSNGEKSLDSYEWNRLRIGQTCSATVEPSKGFMNIKNALEKLCAGSNKCTAEQKDIIKDAVKGAAVIQKKAARAYKKVSFLPL